MRKEGLEPSPQGDMILSHARLPIPPLPHGLELREHYKQLPISAQGAKPPLKAVDSVGHLLSGANANEMIKSVCRKFHKSVNREAVCQ